jgi:hypothetical protein
MRTIVFFFIALLTIPVVQVAFGPRIEHAGAPVLIDRSANVILAVGKHLRVRDTDYPTGPRPERRPKPS